MRNESLWEEASAAAKKAYLKASNERLLKLAAVLDKVPNSRFDMDYWGCGTASCAAGWAGRTKWFNDRGLSLTFDFFNAETGKKIYNLSYENSTSLNAAMKFFGLSKPEAEQLFMKGFNVKPKTKAKQIRNFVAKRKSAAIYIDVYED
jgi:hypothetical protein